VSDGAFFIGWEKHVPRGLRTPLLAVAASLLAGALLLAVALARATDDPGAGDWAGDATLRGTLTMLPYPLLRLPPDAAHPAGHTVLLSAFGKAQLAIDPTSMAGREVQAGGVLVRRGTLDMLVVNDPAQLHVLDTPKPAQAAAEPLGRWRIVGEICDGKCYSGAMRPGAGIAHRACASLCLIGDIPPVLVGVQPAAGGAFFLLAAPDGGPMPATLRRLVALRIRLDGMLERRGDLLVFRVDPTSVEVL
jgi:hypothetical protein